MGNIIAHMMRKQYDDNNHEKLDDIWRDNKLAIIQRMEDDFDRIDELEHLVSRLQGVIESIERHIDMERDTR